MRTRVIDFSIRFWDCSHYLVVFLFVILFSFLCTCTMYEVASTCQLKGKKRSKKPSSYKQTNKHRMKHKFYTNTHVPFCFSLFDVWPQTTVNKQTVKKDEIRVFLFVIVFSFLCTCTMYVECCDRFYIKCVHVKPYFTHMMYTIELRCVQVLCVYFCAPKGEVNPGAPKGAVNPGAPKGEVNPGVPKGEAPFHQSRPFCGAIFFSH
jgi:hypothetical protein